MIVPMQKLTLLCVEGESARTLEALRELGVVHATALSTPSGAGLEKAKARVARLKRLLEAVEKRGGGKGEASGRKAADIADALEKLEAEGTALEAEGAALEDELSRVAMLGDFDPAGVAELREKGISLKVFKAPLKATPDLPEGTCAEFLGSAKKEGFWALAGRGEISWEGAEEVGLPAEAPAAMRKRLAELSAKREELERGWAASAGDAGELKKALAAAEGEAQFEEVRAGMATEGPVSVLQGWIPAECAGKVRDAAAVHGWGLELDEPSADDDVPVLLRPPKWAKPIQAVFSGINILPAYNEADVSTVFMLFFSLFFAMIIGDAGYGAIFLALTLLFRKKLPADARNLLLVTSGATVVWGLVTGTVFGISHDVLKAAHFDCMWINYLTDEARGAQNLMGMCFLIGAVQLTIGHVWNICDLVKQKSLKALEQLGWTMTTWYMFFMADDMVIGGNMAAYLGSPACLKPMSGSALDWVCVAGIVLIALFMMKPSEIKDQWFNLALLPLNIINNFTDVVSYVRLYAVGAAGFAVAEAFNTMIFGGEVTLIGGIVGAVLVFLAHTLNILLCVMGVLVHGIRLNTLEFSNHKGISWSGSAYRPFAKARTI